MSRSIFSAVVIAVLFLSAGAGTARADIISSSSGSLQTVGTIAISTPTGALTNGSPFVFQNGPATWTFDPTPFTTNGATASIMETATLTSTSLTAAGSGAASGASTNFGPSSTYWIGFTPTVNCPFELSGDLAGGVTSSGQYNTGYVYFTQFPPNIPGGPGWTYIISPAYQPTTFDISGSLYAGTNYVLNIGATPGSVPNENAGSWAFSLTVRDPPVSEPSSLSLLGTGLAGLAGLFCRKLVR